nr:hypothetical protein BaRGS_019945 [Batillaria attramentaria]
MKIDGKVLKTVMSRDPVRDVCVRNNRAHSIIVTVAERDFAMAEYDQEGNRWEDVLRKINGPEKFIDSEPFGVAIDCDGRLTVSFLKSDTVFRWDERSGYINWSVIGSTGKDRDEFNGPYYVAKTSQCYSVVSDTGNHRVKIHNQETGKLMAMFGRKGAKPGELFYPQGVCVDTEDNIFVADSGNYRVQQFTDRGVYLSSPVSETWNYGRVDEII